MRAILVLLAMSCGSKKETPPAPGPVPVPKPAPVVVADAGKPPPTKDQLADYKKHMKAGWAQQKQKAWADAVKEFEAALVALPADQRGLSELGWSAMNAGDFVKARKADEEAIVVAVDPKVQASSYYNLGLVQEKTGDKDGAKRSYTLSLALRPNKTVHDALDGLGGKPSSEETTCDLKTACACVSKLAYGEEPDYDPPTCSDGTSPLPGFHVVHVQQAHWDASGDFLLDGKGVVIGQIAGGNFHGRHVEDQKLDKAEVKTIAGHKVLRVQTTDEESTTLVDDSAEDVDAMGEERAATTLVTLCLLDGKTTCPLRDVPLHLKHDYEPAHGKASHSETTAELTIADDGTATVKLVKGASDGRLDAVVGPHKLW
jgi:hypothetical protein